MLTKRIIPCLDVKDGRVVKGVNFVNLRDAGDPVEIAAAYEKEGADELTFLDITASHEKRNIILDIVARTAEKVFMPLTVGGGVRDLDDIRSLLNSGADKVAINTAAVSNPEFVRIASKRFGSQCIVVAIDAKRIDSTLKSANSNLEWCELHPELFLTGNESGLSFEVYTHGGRNRTGINVLPSTISKILPGISLFSIVIRSFVSVTEILFNFCSIFFFKISALKKRSS